MKMLKRAVIREEYVALTGDMEAAIILNQFIYWSERVKDFDKFIEEERNIRELYEDVESEDIKLNGWVYKDLEELKGEIMFTCSTKTISRKIDLLIENGWVDKRRNPINKWDKRLQYRINLFNIYEDLLEIGYVLQDYKIDINQVENFYKKEYINFETSKALKTPISQFDDSISQFDDSISQFDDSISQFDDSEGQFDDTNRHGDAAITETTTKTTLEITTNNNDQVLEIDNTEYEELVRMLLSVINNKNNKPLSDKEIGIVIKHYNGNYKRLRETINYINASQPPEGYKSLVGFFKAALDDAYDISLPIKRKTPKVSFNYKNKFHNFPNRTDKYTAEQLEDVARRKRESYRKKIE